MLGGYKKEHHRAFRIWADSLDGTQVQFSTARARCPLALRNRTCPTICTVNLTGAPTFGKGIFSRPAASPKLLDISRSGRFCCSVMWHAAGCLLCATWRHPAIHCSAAERLMSAGAVQHAASCNRLQT